MTALAADRVPPADIGDKGEVHSYDVTASDIIYRGALVSINASGNVYPTPGDGNGEVIGIAVEKADNAAGAAAAIKCKVRTSGTFEDVLSGATKADIGAAVYCTDDQVITLVTTTNDKVGWIVAVPAAGTVHVRHHWPHDLD